MQLGSMSKIILTVTSSSLPSITAVIKSWKSGKDIHSSVTFRTQESVAFICGDTSHLVYSCLLIIWHLLSKKRLSISILLTFQGTWSLYRPREASCNLYWISQNVCRTVSYGTLMPLVEWIQQPLFPAITAAWNWVIIVQKCTTAMINKVSDNKSLSIHEKACH